MYQIFCPQLAKTIGQSPIRRCSYCLEPTREMYIKIIGNRHDNLHVKCFFLTMVPQALGDIVNFMEADHPERDFIGMNFDVLQKNVSDSKYFIDTVTIHRMCMICRSYITPPQIALVINERDTRLNFKLKWHHLNCFLKSDMRQEYKFCAERINGFQFLTKPFQEAISKMFIETDKDVDSFDVVYT